MSADADHEVIDSPEALFRHLYEEHHVEEALDLDPATAPVQFWLRRHAELERGRREAAPRPAEPAPQPGATGLQGRRPAGFGDPLVEAVARALAGRVHDEAAVRGAIRGYASTAGGRTGEAAVRADLVEPMLRAAAERLLGTGAVAGQRPPAPRTPAGPSQPSRPQAHPPEANPPQPTPPQAGRQDATRAEGGRQDATRAEGGREQPTGPQAAAARREATAEPVAARPRAGEAPAARPAAAATDPNRPEAVWAGLWADLGDGGARRGAAASAAGADDDLMAIADAVQRRKPRRLGEREPRPLRR